MKEDSNKAAIKALQDLCEVDPDTGKYKNSQNFGRNISIGLAIFAIGLCYSFYGLEPVIRGIGFFLGALLSVSIAIYALIKLKVI